MSQRDSRYPVGTVRAVLDTGLVTPPTAGALRQRLGPVQPHPDLLGQEGAQVLAAICDRLIPQPDRAEPIDIAARLHRDVAIGGGDGWRYATLPADGAALVAGVAGVDWSARALTGQGFLDCDDAARDHVLETVQRGAMRGPAWQGLDQVRWFEELLVAVTETYFAHPLAQEEIGYLGMADAQGWPEVGFGAREPFEPIAEAAG